MIGFPLCVDLNGNNCTVFGGDKQAFEYINILLRFGAHVTVVIPTICSELQKLDKEKKIRHIPRAYYRGDCSNSVLCIAATETPDTNIRIATECKAKQIPVYVTNPTEYGNFQFPYFAQTDGCVITIQGTLSDRKLKKVQKNIQEALPEWSAGK